MSIVLSTPTGFIEPPTNEIFIWKYIKIIATNSGILYIQYRNKSIVHRKTEHKAFFLKYSSEFTTGYSFTYSTDNTLKSRIHEV